MTEARITDPKTLRALSHPFRWKLLNLLGDEGPHTATQCSAKLGESVASCSYHLNMLAKYGFVAEVEGPGRQKPWQVIRRKQEITPEGLDDEAAMAAEAATMAWLEQEYERLRQRLQQHDLLSEEWRERDAVGAGSTTAFMTAAELIEFSNAVRALLEPFDARRENPELRPEGAKPVRHFMSATVPID